MSIRCSLGLHHWRKISKSYYDVEDEEYKIQCTRCGLVRVVLARTRYPYHQRYIKEFSFQEARDDELRIAMRNFFRTK